MHWFGSLIVGGRAAILTEIGPKYIFEAIHKERGTIVWLLVPWAQDILGALDRGELIKEDYDLSCWRLMHIGAQPVPPSLVKHWKQCFPDMQYGYLIELKYIARGEFDETKLQEAITDATAQLDRYAGDQQLQSLPQEVTLKKLVLVYKGWELVYREEAERIDDQ